MSSNDLTCLWTELGTSSVSSLKSNPGDRDLNHLSIPEIDEAPAPRAARNKKRIILDTSSDADIPADAKDDSDDEFVPDEPATTKPRPFPMFTKDLSSEGEEDDLDRLISSYSKSKGKERASSPVRKVKFSSPKKSKDEKRKALLRSYDVGNDIPVVMLISLKAGALGLQLTAANNVYLVSSAELCKFPIA